MFYKLILTPATNEALCGSWPQSMPCPMTDVVAENSGSEPRYLLSVKRLLPCIQHSRPCMYCELIGRR